MGIELLKFADAKYKEHIEKQNIEAWIKQINSELEKLDSKELSKVFKFIRTKLIAKI